MDAERFVLPSQLTLEPGVQASLLIKALDNNLQTVRNASHKLQMQIKAERAAKDKNVSQYEHGDLVLFNPREKPGDHLKTKLSPDWLGPYRVIQQVKNDVAVEHLVLQTEAVLHVERLKPFFGTHEQAYDIALHDQHQFQIETFNYYTGNPFVRTSLIFNITFIDGTINLRFPGDFTNTQQYQEFINTIPELFPLRFTAKKAKQEVSKIERLAITAVDEGTQAFVNLRIYDGRTSVWYDHLNLPDKSRPYIVRICFTKWYGRHHREIEAIVPFFGPMHPKYKLILTAYDIQAYVFLDQPYWTTHLLEDNDRRYPQIISTRS